MVATYRYLTGDRVEFAPSVGTLAGGHTSYCWGCGPDADDGLGLRPAIDGSDVVADLVFPARYEGGPGTVHGGAIAAFVDDLLGYVPVAYGSPGVTANLDTNYVRPVPIGVTVSGRAWLARVADRKMWAEAVLHVDETILVEASALFLAIDPTHFLQEMAGLTDEQRQRNLTYRSGDYYP